MPRTAENLPRHELIGLHAAVTDATDPSLTGMDGTVVDETRQTLVIETEAGERTVAKDAAVFRFDLPETGVEIQGNILLGRPEERILKKLPRKWGYTTE